MADQRTTDGIVPPMASDAGPARPFHARVICFRMGTRSYADMDGELMKKTPRENWDRFFRDLLHVPDSEEIAIVEEER